MTFRRFITVGLITAYIGVFNWVYIAYLYPTFGYLGFTLHASRLIPILVESLLAIVPAFWFPITIQRPSQLVYWMLYMFIYIPSMYVPIYVNLQPLYEIMAVSVALFLGIAAIGINYMFPLLKIRWAPVSPAVFWSGFCVVGIGLLGYVIFIYWGHFRLVAFQDVYADGVRAGGSSIAEGTSVGYAIMLLGGCVYPILMALGLSQRRHILFMLGSAGELLLYATAGQKGYILCPIILIGTYLVLLSKRLLPFGQAFPLMMIFISIMIYIGYYVARDDATGFPAIVAAVFFMRVLGWPGLATAMYGEFFDNHPYTYFSHVKGISLFIHYPYDNDLGHVIAYANTGNADLNANAHFWITDGLASYGVSGIIIISMLCGVAFWLMDSAASKHGVIFATLVCVFPGILISNTSLFTAILSGGGACAVLILLMMPVALDTTK